MGKGTKALGHEGTNGALFVALRAFLSVLIAVAVARAETPGGQRVKGELTQIDGLRVLRVWGTPRERGFAEGYLAGEDGARLLDRYLQGQSGADAVKAYEVASFLMTSKMKIIPRYREEMEGMIEGMRAHHVGAVSVLGRPLEYRDLVAINCIPETARIGCSSFAAWDDRTRDGKTIAGRNLDWFANAALKGTQLAVVNMPGPDSIGWISISWPGFIGCLTGMNADGVTMSVHDARSGPASDASNLTPRGLALREALESARAGSAVNDITRVLRQRTSMVGSNIAVTMPFTGNGTASAVFEYDGVLEDHDGVTVRLGDSGEGAAPTWQVCTNHYRSRGKPMSCDRYARLGEELAELKKEGRPLDEAVAWKLLQDVAMSGRVVTYQSVVFEPNRRLMHVAVSVDGRPAAMNKPVTLDVGVLLQDAPKP